MAYNGGYYLPSVSDEGILSWSPTGEGMAPIPEVNVRGPQGEVGPVGPRGEKGDKGDPGLTTDQIELLTLYASAEGRNIPISEDGEIVTEIGHTYTITAGEQPVKCTDADFNPLCEVAAHKQMGFVAPSTAAYVDNITCTVTEVFRAAASVELSGNGGGEPDGDYVTLDANGCITSGRLDTLVDGSYLQYGKKLTEWNIVLPSLSKGDNMFTSCNLSKSSTLTILDSLPTHFDGGIHRLMLRCQSICEIDSEVQSSIENATNRGWNIKISYNYSEQLPLLYTPLECLALVLYSEAYMESVTPTETLEITTDGDYQYQDRRFHIFGSCVVEAGLYSGKYSTNNGSIRTYRPANIGTVGSNQEAERFAKNLLRAVNKDCRSGFVRSPILPGYAPASTIFLSNPRASSWDGTVFLDHIRNDYGTGKSKIFFRRPLEGY